MHLSGFDGKVHFGGKVRITGLVGKSVFRFWQEKFVFAVLARKSFFAALAGNVFLRF